MRKHLNRNISWCVLVCISWCLNSSVVFAFCLKCFLVLLEYVFLFTLLVLSLLFCNSFTLCQVVLPPVFLRFLHLWLHSVSPVPCFTPVLINCVYSVPWSVGRHLSVCETGFWSKTADEAITKMWRVICFYHRLRVEWTAWLRLSPSYDFEP